MKEQNEFREWGITEKLPRAFVKILKEIIAEETKKKKVLISIAGELEVEAHLLSRWMGGIGPLNQDDISALAANLGPVIYYALGLQRPINH